MKFLAGVLAGAVWLVLGLPWPLLALIAMALLMLPSSGSLNSDDDDHWPGGMA